MNSSRYDVLIVGAGAAGLMAAGAAAGSGSRVLLLEKNAKAGRKIGISGKGRCNVTNNCDEKTFLEHVVTNPRFLYSSFGKFDCQSTMALIEQEGVPLKTERGNRVFPVSDRSFDIIDALLRYVRRSGAELKTSCNVDRIEVQRDGSFRVGCGEKTYEAPCLVVTTGGLSYPATGSTGDGFRFAKKLGLQVYDGVPSLVGLKLSEGWCADVSGLTLKNVGLTVTSVLKKKPVYTDFGEMLFTHQGVSGPVILSTSAYLQRFLRQKQSTFDEAGFILHVDLKSGLDEHTLDQRLIRDFTTYHARNMEHAMEDLLPQHLIRPVLLLSHVSPVKKAQDLTAPERQRIVKGLKDLPFHVTGTGSMEEAVVTQGGVDVKEIEPSTMMVKTIPGLFMAGELLDLDALTGGFNLQIAFTTGYAAGKAASLYAQEHN